MDVHCGGFQGNDDGSNDDARRNGDPAHKQELPRGFLYRCALERTRSDRGRESFLRSHGHAEANGPDAEPRAKGGVRTSDNRLRCKMRIPIANDHIAVPSFRIGVSLVNKRDTTKTMP